MTQQPESEDGVKYRVQWSDGAMHMEPGHDRVLNAYDVNGSIFYFTKTRIYRGGPKISDGARTREERKRA